METNVIFKHGFRLLIAALVFLLAPLSHADDIAEGQKTLLYIRLDFEDLPGDPISAQDLAKILNQVDAYYQKVSYGKLSIKSTITPTLRMPHSAAWYETQKTGDVHDNDARVIAKAAGFDTANFDLEIQAQKTRAGGDGGVGIVHGKGLWLNNNFRFGVTVHELGHNFGLPHTHLWKTWDGSIIGSGFHLDFGDAHDPMGGGGDDPRNHLSIRSKSMLGWLAPEGILNVTQNGTYRIYAQDCPGTHGALGLCIIRDARNIYWVEFRQAITENPYMMNGARILRNYTYNNELDLLDMTPGSALGSEDAPLLLGRTFSDSEAGIHITPVNKSDTTPQALDIRVNIGRFPTNHSPTLHLTASRSNVDRDEPLVFRADASDPDGDPLHYSWDFGDSTFDWGKSVVSHCWKASDRDFVVHCFVTDMKGGTANKSLLIRVGRSPLAPMTGIAGVNHRPLEGVRVQISPTNSVVTDSDGLFAFANLEPGVYRLSAQKPGYWFKSIPVVHPSSQKIELKAISLSPDAIVSAEGIVLETDDRLTTPLSYRPPVEMTIVAKTDNTNLRLAYAADQIIFNWEADRAQLRVDGGPANGQHQAGAGAIPPNQYVTIRWLVTPDRQTIYVNDKQRFTHAGDYSQIDRPLSIFTYQSKVTVKSVRVKTLP